MKKLLAFTLAETLIVIGIIGVVSALTLPNLNSSTGEKEKVAKVKKIYQNLEDALGRAVAIYGPVEEWFVNDTTHVAQATRFADRITEFMKVSKNCGHSTGCWSTKSYYSVKGTVWESNYYSSLNDSYRFVILADGTALAIGAGELLSGSFDCPYLGQNKEAVIIRVDIDGPNKGQNKDGVDIFHFRLIDIGITPDNPCFTRTGNLGTENFSQNMTAWVIFNGNMDYLKCSMSELNWETKTSCK